MPLFSRWLTVFTVYMQPRLLVVLVLGFSSGLPLALTFSTLTAWLSEEGISRTTMGLFAAIGTPYALKFLWSPLVDHLPLPLLSRWLGRRRGWIFFTQMLLVILLILLGNSQPAIHIGMTAWLALAIAIASATQDIAIDAFRIEILKEEEQGAGAAMSVFGYRLGMLVSGGGALFLADVIGWQHSYQGMALCIGIGMIVVLSSIKEPGGTKGKVRKNAVHAIGWNRVMGYYTGIIAIALAIYTWLVIPYALSIASSWFTVTYIVYGVTMAVMVFITIGVFLMVFTGKSLATTVWAPFSNFMQKPGWVWILFFIVLYKCGDAFAGVMTMPFLLELGFSKTQIATVVKTYGFVATMLGVFIGGGMVRKIGVMPSLWVGGILQMLSNIVFIGQAKAGADSLWLMGTISVENMSGGLGTAAFVAYISVLCSRHFTATQYALLSSLAAVGRTWLSTASGWVVDQVGWIEFFLYSTALALPGLAILYLLQHKLKYLERSGKL